MAIKPSDGETFLREVDEELRRERINRIVGRYGWAIVAGILLILGAIGGYFWWQNRQQEQAAAQGEALLESLTNLESGNRNAALPKINELAASRVEGYQVAGLFARANAEAGAGNNAAAIATLKSIADNEDFAEAYRHAALVRHTAMEFDRLQPQAVVQRLRPLARPGLPYFGSAGEMVAIAYLKMGQPNRAGPLFAQIGRDENVPPSIRTRAIQMAGSLGINAMPEPDAQAGEQAGGESPAETREKAE